MYQLSYISTAERLMAPHDLADILEQSRTNNIERDITGMLLYHAGTFLQVLEGDEDDVLDIYARIQDDDRHTGILILDEREIEKREFPDFVMGFRHLGDLLRPDQLEGFTSFMQEGFTPEYFQDDPTHAQDLLMHFRDIEMDEPSPDPGAQEQRGGTPR